MNLEQSTYDLIKLFCSEGDEFVDRGDWHHAITAYQSAWKLLPEPRSDWDAACWIWSAIGDVHFYTGNFEEAISSFTLALSCSGGLGNPYVHLRLGESYYEFGNLNMARDNIMRAYMGGDLDLFREEDPKYLECIRDEIR